MRIWRSMLDKPSTFGWYKIWQEADDGDDIVDSWSGTARWTKHGWNDSKCAVAWLDQVCNSSNHADSLPDPTADELDLVDG